MWLCNIIIIHYKWKHVTESFINNITAYFTLDFVNHYWSVDMWLWYIPQMWFLYSHVNVWDPILSAVGIHIYDSILHVHILGATGLIMCSHIRADPNIYHVQICSQWLESQINPTPSFLGHLEQSSLWHHLSLIRVILITKIKNSWKSLKDQSSIKKCNSFKKKKKKICSLFRTWSY